jgi:hypothetical protein
MWTSGRSKKAIPDSREVTFLRKVFARPRKPASGAQRRSLARLRKAVVATIFPDYQRAGGQLSGRRPLRHRIRLRTSCSATGKWFTAAGILDAISHSPPNHEIQDVEADQRADER